MNYKSDDFLNKEGLVLSVKHFSELSPVELYEILKARAAVFVVEQNCVYQDLDDIDYQAYHICINRKDFASNKESAAAYLRIFESNADRETLEAISKVASIEKKIIKIGRVLTTERGTGLGSRVLRAGMNAAINQMNAEILYLEAQTYATGFYEKAGFQVISEEFLEDGIPHVKMIYCCE